MTYVTGCATTTVTIQPEGLVKLGPDVQGHVYVRTKGQWVLSKNAVHLPEGWYAHDCKDCE